MKLSPSVVALLCCLWLPLCALAGAPRPPLAAPPLQSVEGLRAELFAERSRALRSDICQLGPDLQSVCGQRASDALASLCDGAAWPQSETLKALTPFLAGPSGRTCPPGTVEALEKEAKAQQALPLCAEARRALANTQLRCQVSSSQVSALHEQVDSVCGAFLSLRSAEVGRKELQRLSKLAEAQSCEDSLMVQEVLEPQGGEPAVRGTTLSSAGLPVSTDFQGMLLNGLTSFLLERARVESIAYVLDEVSDTLCKEPSKDAPALSARSLFPLTCALVTSARKSGMLLIPGPMLHRTLVEDLQNLPARLSQALPLSTQEQALAHCSLTVAHRFGQGLLAKRVPLQLVVGALRSIAEEPSCQLALGLPQTGSSLRWLSLSKAVEAAAGLLQEADPDTLQRWARDPRLLLAKLEPVLDPAIADQLRDALDDIIPLAVQAELSVLSLRATEPGTDAQRAAFLEVVRSSMALLSAVIQAGVQLQPLQDDSSLHLLVVQHALEATADLFSGDFAGGLTRLVSSQLLPLEQEPFKTLLQFSPLLASLGSAKTSDEMAAAFEAAAAPVGSFRLKRQKTTLGLGARVGAIVSLESILSDSGRVPDGLTLGPWLPVGLDASLPAFNGKHTFGLLLQLIDLGGLANARLAQRERTVEGTTVQPQVAPKLGFVQVVSPGVSAYWGIGHTPFVLSLGVSMAPALRSATFRTGEAQEEKDYNVLRTSLSLSVDIPLYIR